MESNSQEGYNELDPSLPNLIRVVFSGKHGSTDRWRLDSPCVRRSERSQPPGSRRPARPTCDWSGPRVLCRSPSQTLRA